jgi:hypothetical protein
VPKQKRWVAKVNTDSTHPPEEPFTRRGESGDRREIAGFEKSISQGIRIGHAHADHFIFHPSRWLRSNRDPKGGTGQSPGVVVVVEEN